MEEHGEFLIQAPRQEVWDALQNPDILKRCIDGCEEMIAVEPDFFTCVVALKLGPVKARFKGEIRLKDVEPPNRYTLDVAAQGGAAGFGKGQAFVELLDGEDGVMLKYKVQGAVGGKLAQIGSRLIQSFSKKMSRNFFSEFANSWN